MCRGVIRNPQYLGLGLGLGLTSTQSRAKMCVNGLWGPFFSFLFGAEIQSLGRVPSGFSLN